MLKNYYSAINSQEKYNHFGKLLGIIWQKEDLEVRNLSYKPILERPM